MKTNKKTGKKKLYVAVTLAGLVALVGGTIAYHHNTGIFNGLFKLGYWENVTTDDVPIGGGNWQPCEERAKIVTAKNTGSVTAVVRMKYEEYWKAAGSTSTDHTTELPLKDSDNDDIAHVNLQNLSDWVLNNDGWYYYRYTLSPGEESSSLLKSVTLNCKNNFAGENSVCTVVGNKKSCTKPDNQYDAADFHVFVTVEYLQADGCNDVWGQCAEDVHAINCDSNLLYDHVACLTNGPDGSFDYAAAPRIGTNGNGVNTLAAHKDDFYPVYYYRGIVDNSVVLGDYCWRIVRTTGTGGVKMLFAGDAVTVSGKKQCRDISDTTYGETAAISVGGTRKHVYNGYPSTQGGGYGIGPHMYGYMYKNLSKTSINYYNTLVADGGHKVGKDVEWDGSRYVLKDVVDYNETYRNTHRYFCSDNVTKCKTVYFALHHDGGTSQGNVAYFILRGGEKYEDAIHDNEADSNAKTTVETWFGSNMAAYQDKLEDTVFCNDRTIDLDKFKNTGYSNHFEVSMNSMTRFTNKTPTVDCPDKRDAFTVSASNGNGKLQYPVGLMTMDEVMLGGGREMGTSDNDYKQSYLWAFVGYTSDSNTWTMTPAGPLSVNRDFAWTTYMFDFLASGTGNMQTGSLRPVISVKPGTRFVEGGTGTLTNPYVIE